jgi:ribulose-phosphate 3-epimerase
MTVNPGWGGQAFIPSSPDKVSRLASIVGDAKIEVDGGVDTGTAGSVAEAGADSITFHEEATPHANRTLAAIRELGCLAGIAINPGTPADALAELRGLADIALCMTVNPGWGGQAFIPSSPDKVSRLASIVGDAKIEVDGGVDVGTAGSVAEAGASLFVAGSAVFGADDPAAAYTEIAAAAGAA